MRLEMMCRRNEMIYADKSYDFGRDVELRGSLVVAKELVIYWFGISNQSGKLPKKYIQTLLRLCHDGNKSADHLRSVIKMIDNGDRSVNENNLWYPLNQTYMYVIFLETIMDACGFLGGGDNDG